jgi:hypothetical protein
VPERHRFPARELDTTTNIRGSAKRIAAFTLQHGAMLTPQQPDRRRAEAALWRAAKAEGCVPVVVSKCVRFRRWNNFAIEDAGRTSKLPTA